MNGLDRDMEMPQPPDEPKEQGELCSKELLGDGTKLYHRTMAECASMDDGGELMRQVWSPTPWMIDVDVGIENDERRREIRNWCNRNLGDETTPYGEHRRGGAWNEGHVTIMGKTWYGFKTREMMERFQQRFQSPNAPDQRPQTLGHHE
jgi:hypothetical protein